MNISETEAKILAQTFPAYTTTVWYNFLSQKQITYKPFFSFFTEPQQIKLVVLKLGLKGNSGIS